MTAKPGIDGSNVASILHDIATNSGWALCIGAGTSIPIFPSWNSLVRQLIALEVGVDDVSPLGENLLSLTAEEFAQLLSNELYSNLRKNLSSDDWNVVGMAFRASGPMQLGIETWLDFLRIISSKLPKTTAFLIAEVMSEVLDTEFAPAAILSFNAEPMLIAIMNALLVEGRINSNYEFTPVSMRNYFDLVTRGISNRNVSRIPYIFCHGVLPPPWPTVGEDHFTAIDKLVFSENEYLQLSNASYSWQSSAFLDVCGYRKVVFIGLSLSDPNMRRWLSWIQQNRTVELMQILNYTGASTVHFWIRTLPESEHEQRWIESSVAHLGVRLIWINEWSEVGTVLRRMLGLSLPDAYLSS